MSTNSKSLVNMGGEFVFNMDEQTTTSHVKPLLNDSKYTVCVVADGVPYIVYVVYTIERMLYNPYPLKKCTFCDIIIHDIYCAHVRRFEMIVLHHLHETIERMKTSMFMCFWCGVKQNCKKYILDMVKMHGTSMRKTIINNNCPLPSSLMTIVEGYVFNAHGTN